MRRFNFIILSLIFLLAFAGAGFAALSENEVARLNQEAPSFSSYNNAPAIIWRRAKDYKVLDDGNVELTRTTLILMGEHVPAQWRRVSITPPAGGTLSIKEAAVYNPMTAMAEANLPVEIKRVAAVDICTIEITDELAAGRVVSVITTEIIPKIEGRVIDATVMTSDILPVWEEVITADVPEGTKLQWFGNEMSDPNVIKEGSREIYKWEATNLLPWYGSGFIVNKRPFVSFSDKSGLRETLDDLQKEADAIPDYPVPSAAIGGKSVDRIMEWISSPANTITGLPSNFRRVGKDIPPDGPWTPWEQTLLLNKWLTKLGKPHYLWWQSQFELDELGASTISVWSSPVISFAGAKKKPIYYQAGQSVDFGELPPTLAGTEIYRIKGKGVEHRKITSGRPRENTLSFVWNSKIDQNGLAKGTLAVNVTGSWAELFSRGRIPELSEIQPLLLRTVDFAMPGLDLTPVSVKKNRTGYKMNFQVTFSPSIISQQNMLVRLPGSLPMTLGGLIRSGKQYTFRFPFVIDQTVRMAVPKNFRLLQQPVNRADGDPSSSLLTQSILLLPGQSVLNADSRWTVKVQNVGGENAETLRRQLGQMIAWPRTNLAFKK